MKTGKKIIVFATSNYGKLAEVKAMIDSNNIELRCLKDFPAIAEPVEDGTTFLENATIKAKYYYEHLNYPVLCDDSGLSVNALNGEPGVYSARYAGVKINQDVENMKKLLNKLNNVSDRLAHFNCTMVYYNGVDLYSTEGILNGQIIDSPRGTNGFGYDPIFMPLGYSKTLAELNQEEKNHISHRHLALIKMVEILKKN